MSFSIESLALPGEVYITQFVVCPEHTGMSTKEEAEATLREYYADRYVITRFYYGDMAYDGERVTSQEYGRRVVSHPKPLAEASFGGVVFGTPKS